ncbi:uncharacterized protein LOC108343878 [Vigna angularis]|uniref:uncharacterized protein LOC108343878 n=1 Tax=Phaseolus angularis TaxID=3914 RepID=UPI000809A8E2|nr:uncharacterized protein LOC108343878 [Vigna angularis]
MRSVPFLLSVLLYTMSTLCSLSRLSNLKNMMHVDEELIMALSFSCVYTHSTATSDNDVNIPHTNNIDTALTEEIYATQPRRSLRTKKCYTGHENQREDWFS